MQKSVLITGGTGFLGVHLARFFLKKKYDVILLDIAELTAKDLIGKVTVEKVDITDKKSLISSFVKHKPNYVVHAAAALPIQHDRKTIFSINVDGTRNVLESANKSNVSRLVFISSTALYGVPQHLPEKETDPISPIGHYGESKQIGEELCLSFHKKKKVTVNILRPKTFLGPERLGVFTLWFEAIHNNKPVFMLGKGHNLYQLLEVSDLCHAIEGALLCKKTGEIFNVGTDKYATWSEDLGGLIHHAKSTSKIVGFPVLPSQIALSILEALNLSPIVAWHYKTLPVNSYVSIEKAKKQIKFKPTKSNKEILIESYDWYKKHRKEFIGKTGTTHRTIWNFKLLNILNRFS
jgi:nucleoside-diphosphate-sugar epimerase